MLLCINKAYTQGCSTLCEVTSSAIMLEYLACLISLMSRNMMCLVITFNNSFWVWWHLSGRLSQDDADDRTILCCDLQLNSKLPQFPGVSVRSISPCNAMHCFPQIVEPLIYIQVCPCFSECFLSIRATTDVSGHSTLRVKLSAICSDSWYYCARSRSLHFLDCFCHMQMVESQIDLYCVSFYKKKGKSNTAPSETRL